MGAAISSADAAATDTLLPSAPKIFTVAMVGLDGAGCTSILNRLLHGTNSDEPDLPPTQPTMTLDRVTIPHGPHRIAFWNPSGHEKMRNLWSLFPHAHAFIFVVDASARDCLPAAKQALHDLCAQSTSWMCADPEFPFLVLASKTDVEGAASVQDVAEALDLEGLAKWRGGAEVGILATSTLTGAGLKATLDRLVARVSH
ncbi:ADP-ribosylation factor family-domain-containing protein [Mycena amicta]|nr:ADP-ribosylation factor family-domain-containing protein [Mycena amicta]